MIKYGIFSAPGLRQTPMIHAVLGSLARCGVLSVRVQIDDGSFGAMGNYDMLLSGMIANSEKGDQLVVLQDDMVACPRLHDILEGAAIGHGDRVHALFTPAQNIPDHRDANGWVDINPGWGGWGGCFMIPREIALRMVNDEFWRAHAARSRKQADACTWEVMRLRGIPVAAHVPSLLDHIGMESTLGHEHSDETRGFRFNEWSE